MDVHVHTYCIFTYACNNVCIYVIHFASLSTFLDFIIFVCLVPYIYCYIVCIYTYMCVHKHTDAHTHTHPVLKLSDFHYGRRRLICVRTPGTVVTSIRWLFYLLSYAADHSESSLTIIAAFTRIVL